MSYRWTQADIDAQVKRMGLKDAPTLAQYTAMPQAKKPAKYRNVKTTDASGAVHDSTKEFRRWQELQLRERAGEIRSLRRQVPYALVHDGVLVCRYVADFVYEEGEATVVEDVKSPPTRKLEAYRIKKNLMKAIYKLEVREV